MRRGVINSLKQKYRNNDIAVFLLRLVEKNSEMCYDEATITCLMGCNYGCKL